MFKTLWFPRLPRIVTLLSNVFMTNPSLHRIFGCALLMAYVATGSPLVSATVAVMAAIDDSHIVEVQDTAQGTQLVLRHRDANITPGIHDHSHGLARFIVAFCKPDTHGDHQFATAYSAITADAWRNGSIPPESQSDASIHPSYPACLSIDRCSKFACIGASDLAHAGAAVDVAQRHHQRGLATVLLLL